MALTRPPCSLLASKCRNSMLPSCLHWCHQPPCRDESLFRKASGSSSLVRLLSGRRPHLDGSKRADFLLYVRTKSPADLFMQVQSTLILWKEDVLPQGSHDINNTRNASENPTRARTPHTGFPGSPARTPALKRHARETKPTMQCVSLRALRVMSPLSYAI